jgi:hypothetical protein
VAGAGRRRGAARRRPAHRSAGADGRYPLAQRGRGARVSRERAHRRPGRIRRAAAEPRERGRRGGARTGPRGPAGPGRRGVAGADVRGPPARSSPGRCDRPASPRRGAAGRHLAADRRRARPVGRRLDGGRPADPDRRARRRLAVGRAPPGRRRPRRGPHRSRHPRGGGRGRSPPPVPRSDAGRRRTAGRSARRGVRRDELRGAAGGRRRRRPGGGGGLRHRPAVSVRRPDGDPERAGRRRHGPLADRRRGPGGCPRVLRRPGVGGIRTARADRVGSVRRALPACRRGVLAAARDGTSGPVPAGGALARPDAAARPPAVGRRAEADRLPGR